jgi:hypothetical protein
MQALPYVSNFKLRIFLKVKKNLNFLKRADFFIAGMAAQGDEVTGRVLMGDNTGGGAFGLQNKGVWTSSVLPCILQIQLAVCKLNSDLCKIQFAPDLPQRLTTAQVGVCLY